jgi:hypothetical protein
MKHAAYPFKRSLFALAAMLLISTATARGQSPPPGSIEQSAPRQLNMLVLGDSISWGQGLKDDHKAWHLVKTWLQQTTGRDVRERVEAHSGAVIGSTESTRISSTEMLNGEVNRALPSVNEQIDAALRSYADPGLVDLVLVDGCINDVDAKRLLNASNTPDEIRRLAETKCGALVEMLLDRINGSFPNAHVILTGYFPIISEETSNDFLMKALARSLYTPEAGAPKMSDKQLRARLIDISREWYQASNHWLNIAADKVDARQAAQGSHRRVLFAEVVFLPEHSFRARDARLWGFEASFLRKVLIVLTLGKVALKTNDERRAERNASCKAVLKPPPGERKADKRNREARLLLCRIAAIGHPNRKGALMYASAISDQLKIALSASGWLRDATAGTAGTDR